MLDSAVRELIILSSVREKAKTIKASTTTLIPTIIMPGELLRTMAISSPAHSGPEEKLIPDLNLYLIVSFSLLESARQLLNSKCSPQTTLSTNKIFYATQEASSHGLLTLITNINLAHSLNSLLYCHCVKFLISDTLTLKQVLERACTQLPRSYKLWKMVRQRSPGCSNR